MRPPARKTRPLASLCVCNHGASVATGNFADLAHPAAISLQARVLSFLLAADTLAHWRLMRPAASHVGSILESFRIISAHLCLMMYPPNAVVFSRRRPSHRRASVLGSFDGVVGLMCGKALSAGCCRHGCPPTRAPFRRHPPANALWSVQLGGELTGRGSGGHRRCSGPRVRCRHD